MRKRLKRHKVLYFGGNLLGCLCLRELLRIRIVEIVAVVGRYNDNGSVVDPKAWNASLLRVATQKGLSFLQPKDITDPDYLALIMEHERPDFIVTVQYDQPLAAQLLSHAKRGCIDLSFSPVSEQQSWLPIPWALVDERPIDVTMHWIENDHYNGDIIASDQVEVMSDDTAQTVYRKVTQAAYHLFKQVFPKVISDEAPRIQHSIIRQKECVSGYPFDRNIDWGWDDTKIDRMVRALTFPPYPSARTYYRDMEVEILNPIGFVEGRKNGHEPGEIVDITERGIVVQSAGQRVLIARVRINQSLTLDARKFCQQFQVKVGDVFRTRP